MEEKTVVLLIDDEVDFTQSLSFWLKSKGYDVLVASGGQAGVDMLKDNAADIVFLDLNMPGMDGVQTLKEIRKLNKNIPVVFVSAYVDDRRMKEANPYGISGIFFKGKDFSEGLSLLESVLRTHKKLKK